MKRILLTIPFLIITLFSNAQHTVSGIVSDKNDVTLLLEGVNVFIPELNKTDISKEGGTYIVKNVGIGTVHIQFSKEGYQTEVKVISTKDSAVVINIELEKSILEPSSVTLSSLNSNLPATTVFPVSIYSAKELATYGTLDPLTSLTYKPEAEILNDGNANTHLTIRGSGLNRVAYYNEGTRLEMNSWESKYALGLNYNGTESYELVTGPAALIYGANASSGVLVLHDEKPAITGDVTGDVKLKYNTNTVGLNGEAGVKGSSLNGLFYSVRLGGDSHTSYIQGEGDEKKLNTEERPFASNSKFNSMNAKLIAGINKRWGVSKISYSHLNLKNGIINVPEESQNLVDGVEREREITEPYQEVVSDLIRSNTFYFLNKSKFNLDLSYQSNDKKTFENNFSNVPENTDALKMSGFNFDLNYTSDALKDWVYTIGGQGGFFDSKNGGTFSRIPDASENYTAAYAFVKYKLKHWNFEIGGRFNSRSQELTPYKGVNDTSSSRPSVMIKKDFRDENGSFGVSFQPIRMLNLKAGVSTGFTMPDYGQLAAFSLNSRMNRFEIGTPELDLERNWQVDLAASLELSAVAVELKGFSNRITDYISAYSTGKDTIVPVDSNSVDTFSVFRYRQDDASINGLEISVTINPPTVKWLKLQLAYSLLEGKFESGDYLPYIPADKLTASLTIKGEKMNYIYKPYFTFIARNYSKREKVSLYEEKAEGYLLLDFLIGGSFKWGKQLFDIGISANNLLNTDYYNQFSETKNLGQSGVYDMGRNVSVQLHIPFGIKSN